MDFIKRYSYLSSKAKSNLTSKYKYVGTDSSFFSTLLNPYWELCAKALPKRMAPNTVTASGFVGVVVALGTVLLYNPTLNSGATTPSWVYLFAAALLFYYQTMDAIDGKHARNTNSSSALGELFDHGLDALTTMCQSYIIITALQLGPSYWSVACMFLIYVTSYLVIWEDYVTDELRFGVLNSPTEAILMAVAICVSTAVLGYSVWEISIFGVGLNHIVVSGCILMALSVIAGSLTTVLTKAKQGNNHRANDIGGLNGAIKGLLPFIAEFVLYVIYAYSAPEVVHNQIITFLASYGLIASYLQTRMILARVCSETIPLVPVVLYPLPFVVLNALGPQIALRFVDSAHLVYVLACYAHLVYNGIHEMTLVLGIECFTMRTHPKVPQGYAKKD
jgi:ethanolaminephosphotransferase